MAQPVFEEGEVDCTVYSPRIFYAGVPEGFWEPGEDEEDEELQE
jgi:hypothetical protein